MATLVTNHINGVYLRDALEELLDRAPSGQLDAAVAYVTSPDRLLRLTEDFDIPTVRFWALCNQDAQPHLDFVRRMLSGPPGWQLFLTAAYYHPKVYWFRGAGAYIGSGNLTDAAWVSNVECGVLYSETELIELGLLPDLQGLFDALPGRSRPAIKEDVQAIRRIRAARRSFDQKASKAAGDAAIQHLIPIPGEASPHPPKMVKKTRGEVFMREWTETLSLLRKLAAEVEGSRVPRTWMPDGVPPSVELDQMFNLFYFRQIERQPGGAALRVDTLHDQNESDPAAAFTRIVAAWMAEPEPPDWIVSHLTEWTSTLRALLTEQSLRTMTVEQLEEVFMRSWAVREHSRRLDNDLLGLDPTKTWDEPTKTRLLARWMWDRKTRGGHMVHDMLRWVIWAPLADVPKRLWEATQGKSPWRMDHLGLSALGELVGMARPDDFPPRNNRTSRTVHALGWTVRRYGG